MTLNNALRRGAAGTFLAFIAAAGATAAVASAVVGSIVRSVPAGCVPVSYGGMVYQQCGAAWWYAPQGSQNVVVNPPRQDWTEMPSTPGAEAEPGRAVVATAARKFVADGDHAFGR